MNPSDEPTITLIFCGTGDKKYASSLKERARKLDLLGRTVHFEGHV